MKIVIDTVTKRAICPPEFFESIREINEANDVDEKTDPKDIMTSERYLQKLLEKNSKTIVNKNDLPKGRRTRKN